MKKILIASCIALFAAGSQAVAQSSQSTDKAQVSVQDEIRALSAELKEAYGILSQDIAHLNREIGTNPAAATPAQATMRDRMKATLTRLEGMLTTVNSADESQWEAVKAKSAVIRTEALDLVKERKEASR